MTLDAPDPFNFKGGLYPQAIRQHAEIGLDVCVASLRNAGSHDEEYLSDLGATWLPLEDDTVKASHAVGPSWLQARLRRKKIRERVSRIADVVSSTPPICIVGLQSHHTGFAARAIGQKLRVPYVCWEHLTGYERGIKFSRSDRQLRRLFSESFVTATVSQSLLNTIRRRFAIDLPRGTVIPNPIPEGFALPPTGTTPDWLDAFSKGRFLFGAWTSWRAQKRLDVLLLAFEKVRQWYDDVALVVAGGMVENYCGDLVARQDKGSVLFPGPISRSDVHHLAHRVDCCVISSDYETFGLPMLEALSAGRPVVSTRCAGPDDVLGDPRLGRLCERGDVDGLAGAMAQIYEGRDEFDASTIADAAIDRFGEQAQLRRWRSIYEPLLLEQRGMEG